MGKFWHKTLLYGLLVLMSYAVVSLFAGGPSEPLYSKYTGSRKKSMIIGTSRAFMGLDPSTIDSVFAVKRKKQLHVYNFAFTEIHASFGEVYFNAVKKKLDTTSRNQLFIVTVDPWAISVSKQYREDPNSYPETKLSLATTQWFNVKPNFSYLKNAYNLSWGHIISEKIHNKYPERTVHPSGWLEVREFQDSLSLAIRIHDKVKYLEKGKSRSYVVSEYRKNHLQKIIAYLSKFGKVILVRIPVHPEILKVEDAYMPDFDNCMSSIAAKLNIRYFSRFHGQHSLVFFDGHHLESTSAKAFSSTLAELINNQLDLFPNLHQSVHKY